MSEWTELHTMKDVAEAQERGDEIEGSGREYIYWVKWLGDYWSNHFQFRSRPAKRTKTVVMREYVFSQAKRYGYDWASIDVSNSGSFVKWTGNERTEEVPK